MWGRVEERFNPFSPTSGEISRLKCACTCLQSSIFCGPVTYLLSVLHVLMKICSHANV